MMVEGIDDVQEGEGLGCPMRRLGIFLSIIGIICGLFAWNLLETAVAGIVILVCVAGVVAGCVSLWMARNAGCVFLDKDLDWDPEIEVVPEYPVYHAPSRFTPRTALAIVSILVPVIPLIMLIFRMF